MAVIGLGSSGEAAARLATEMGGRVYASDISAGEEQRAAAGRLREVGIDAEAGGHDMDRVLDCRLVVVSPGVPPSADVRRRIREAGIRTVSEAELAFWRLKARVVGVTGTNGKTTTTALCGHLLRNGGIDAVTGGNIGRPLSDVALSDPQPDWVVVELSSFQLADIEAFRPDVGVFLNLAPDHLDRYRSVDAYYADKKRIFDNESPESRWVLNGEDRDVLELARNVSGEVYRFSARGPVDPGAWVDDREVLRLRLDDRSEEWLPADELRLLGDHNVENALAAGLSAALLGCAGADIADGLRDFEPLPHRLQPVGEHGGIRWINDSKATNVAAARVAVAAFDGPVVLALGGRHKGESYGKLVDEFGDRLRAVIAFGEAAPKIVGELGDGGVPVHVAGGVEDVVEELERLAEPGDVALFSPACSSYDMFPNYRVRGETFASAVRRRLGGGDGE